MASVSPWGGSPGPSLWLPEASCHLTPLRPRQGLGSLSPWPSPATRIKPWACLAGRGRGRSQAGWPRIRETGRGAKGERAVEGAEGLSPWESEAPPARPSPFVPVPSLLPQCGRAGRGRERRRRRRGGAQRNSPGSGMPGIQVTRRCQINGSSPEPRTAWRSLPGERKRLQAGLPLRPSPARSQKPAGDFLSLAEPGPQSRPSTTGRPILPASRNPPSPDSKRDPRGRPLPTSQRP